MTPGTQRTGRRHWRRLLGHSLIAAALAGITQFALADAEYVSAWGPGVGTQAPLLAANDQAGKPRTLDTLTGPNGLLFVFNRSVDW